MENIATLSTFLGWCTLINVAVLILASIVLIGFNQSVKGLHSKMMAISPQQLDDIYVRYLANYKLAIILFNLVPYCALKIMA